MPIIANNFNVPPEMVSKAELILSRVGYSVEEAVKAFFGELIAREDIPFEVPEYVPNAETQAAFDRVEEMIAGRTPMIPITNLDAFFAEVEAEALAEMEADGEI